VLRPYVLDAAQRDAALRPAERRFAVNGLAVPLDLPSNPAVGTRVLRCDPAAARFVAGRRIPPF
jgi:hypothetical protein